MVPLRKTFMSETKQLYKRFVRIAKKWPQQPNRQLQFNKFLLDKVRNDFRTLNDIDLAKRELVALESIVYPKDEVFLIYLVFTG